MKRSNRLVLLVGVFLAVVAFVGIALLLNPTTKPPDQIVSKEPTVLATQDIPLGTTITGSMVAVQELDVATERRTDAFTSDKLVIGQVARRKIGTGSQLVSADFDTASTGCGTIDVPTGLRAMSVQVDQVSGVGTVINAGDYTDAVVGFTGDKFPVVTLNPQDNSITVVAGVNSTSVKLLVEGMQVLCRQLPPPTTTANGQQTSTGGDAGNGGSEQPQVSLNGQQEIVILAVTPAQAEILKFAQLDGSISLILRSAADFKDGAIPAPAGTEGVTLKKLTTDFAVPIPELVEAILPAQGK